MMQSLPVVSPAVPGMAGAADSVPGGVQDVDGVPAGESFDALLGGQIKAVLAAQLAASSKLADAAQLVDTSDPSTQADALMPVDLAALLASIMPAGSQAQAGLAQRNGEASPALRQVDELPGSSSTDVTLFDMGKPKPPVSAGAEFLSAEKDILAAELAETGKKLPLASAKTLPDLPVKDQISGVNPNQAMAISRPDLPQTAALPANPHATSIEPRVGSAAWDGALGQKVVWLVNQNQQTAEMRLNPPNLGPLEIKLTISSDQASAMFVSPHASVRDAVESALPRLREMLAESGITLGNVNVSAESFTKEQTFGSQDHGQSAVHDRSAGIEVDVLPAQRSGVLHLPLRGGVDTFA